MKSAPMTGLPMAKNKSHSCQIGRTATDRKTIAPRITRQSGACSVLFMPQLYRGGMAEGSGQGAKQNFDTLRSQAELGNEGKVDISR